jgi:Na+-translocating ferredoxin:NAD+ oxidoreductase subunit G
MAQRESTFVNMFACLFIITLVSGGILGFVHEKTKDAIELAKTKAQSVAIANVLPPFTKLGKSVKVLPENSSDSIEIFPAYTDGKMVGMAVRTYSDKGFSGHISIMAGIDTLGNFTGYEVLEHKETPGLGSKMVQWFRNPDKPGQDIIGKNPATTRFKVKKDGGDIDAITASTITSRAFLDALSRANAGIEMFKTGNPGNNNQLSH